MKTIVVSLLRKDIYVRWFVYGSDTSQVIVELAFAGGEKEIRHGDYGCCYWILNHHMWKGCHMGSHG